MRTMSWPPTGGGTAAVTISGADATAQLVATSLGDMSSLPHVDNNTYLGDVTFKPAAMVEGRVQGILRQFVGIIRDARVTVKGSDFFVKFVDVDSGKERSV